LKYEWKQGIGVFTKYDAQKVGEELESIPVLKPERVVEYAERHKDSELYKCLEWDDTKAAKSWRKQQAADILRLIIVVETVEEGSKTRKIKIRAFENAVDEEKGSIYLPTRDAMKDPEYRGYIIEKIRRGICELSEKGKNYEAIINDNIAYQKGLNDALGALGERNVKKEAKA
jgi:hypothetical protein